MRTFTEPPPRVRLEKELKTFYGCEIREARIGLLKTSPDMNKYKKLLEKGLIQTVNAPKAWKDSNHLYTWFGLTEAGYYKLDCWAYYQKNI